VSRSCLPDNRVRKSEPEAQTAASLRSARLHADGSSARGGKVDVGSGKLGREPDPDLSAEKEGHIAASVESDFALFGGGCHRGAEGGRVEGIAVDVGKVCRDPLRHPKEGGSPKQREKEPLGHRKDPACLDVYRQLLPRQICYGPIEDQNPFLPSQADSEVQRLPVGVLVPRARIVIDAAFINALRDLVFPV
jgi:hypothetical protein